MLYAANSPVMSIICMTKLQLFSMVYTDCIENSHILNMYVYISVFGTAND
jgi:hypothetical protein